MVGQKRMWTAVAGAVGALVFLVAGTARAGGRDESNKCCQLVCDKPGTNEPFQLTCVPKEFANECFPDDPEVYVACEQTFGQGWYADEAVFHGDRRCDTDQSPPACADQCSRDPELDFDDTVIGHGFQIKGTFLSWGGSWRLRNKERSCENPDCPCCKLGKFTAGATIDFTYDPPIGSGGGFTFAGDLTNDTMWCAEAVCEEDPVWTCGEYYCSSSTKKRTFSGTSTISAKIIDWALLKVTGSIRFTGSTSAGETTMSGENPCGGCCDGAPNPTSTSKAGKFTITGRATAKIGWGWFSYTIDIDAAKGCLSNEQSDRGTCGGGRVVTDEWGAYLGLACGISGTAGIADAEIDQSVCMGHGWYSSCYEAKPADGGCLIGVGDPSSC